MFHMYLCFPLLQDDALHDAMELALTRNRVEFVKPLLEQGLLMNNFLTHERLQTLYSNLVSV